MARGLDGWLDGWMVGWLVGELVDGGDDAIGIGPEVQAGQAGGPQQVMQRDGVVLQSRSVVPVGRVGRDDRQRLRRVGYGDTGFRRSVPLDEAQVDRRGRDQ